MTLTDVIRKAPPTVQLDISYCTEVISKMDNVQMKIDWIT